MKRRQVTPFGLAFLDIMSCGLGAAVLLFLIIKHQTDQTVESSQTLSAETLLLEEEIAVGQENLARIKNTISDVDEQLAIAQGLAKQIQQELDDTQGNIADLGPSSADQIIEIQEQIDKLTRQKQALEKENEGGNRNVAVVGEGDRQYLTGLKLGGQHILILLDSSASMLDETIINIIRRRNRSNEVKLASEKWQQAQGIVSWILANVEQGAQFQVYTFNETPKPAIEKFNNKWIDTANKDNLVLALDNLKNTVPEKGTSLRNAFSVIKTLSPRPDNIFLVTDGLPTIDKERDNNKTVTGRERLSLFNKAREEIPGGIPINTLLLPMEGDLLAAAAFWQLAIDTQGSFIAPPRDWP